MKVKYGLITLLAVLIFVTPFISFFIKGEDTPTPPPIDNDSQNTGQDNKGTDTQNTNTNSKGEFKLLDVSNNSVTTLSDLEYLYGAVASEMPASYHEEALKAQAVACYTYAYKLRAHQESTPSEDLKGAHFKVDSSQDIGYISKERAKEKFENNFQEQWDKIEKAVNQVYDQIVVYKNEPIIASYHAISTGKTETAETVWGGAVPYLVNVDSPSDKEVEGYKSDNSFTLEELKEKFTALYKDIEFPKDQKKWISGMKKSKAGTVTSIKVGNKTLTGKDVRTALDLRSAAFDMELKDDKFSFTVYGYGHGVGMSQAGANKMASDGKTYKDILLHYYPGTELKQTSSEQKKEEDKKESNTTEEKKKEA